jgi:hypothetical protein
MFCLLGGENEECVYFFVKKKFLKIFNFNFYNFRLFRFVVVLNEFFKKIILLF